MPVVAATVLERPEIVMVVELRDLMLVMGERSGWTSSLALTRDAVWLSAAPRPIDDAMRAQGALFGTCGAVRATVTSVWGEQRLILMSDDSALVGTPDQLTESRGLGSGHTAFLLEQLRIVKRAHGGAS